MSLTDRFRTFVRSTRGEKGTLQREAVEGVFWTTGATAMARLVSFLKTIVLARLLAPADFGLFGTAIAACAALQVFSETGATTLLVQKKDISDRYWHSGQVISAVRGMVLCVFMLLSSGFIAGFYDRPALGSILRVMALYFLLEGFYNIALVQLQKHMRFKRRVAIVQVADLLGSIGAIVMGITFRSVWALVFGKVFTSFCLLVLSWLLLDYRPRFRFDRSLGREFLTFGRPMFLVSVLVYIITSVDDLILGKVLGMTMLGYYTMAYGLANIPTLQVARTISQVAFPAYARMQDDPEKLRSGFTGIFFYSTISIAPISVGLAVLSREFTMVVLEPKWEPMIPILTILAFLGLFRGIASTIGPLLLGSGHPKFLRNMKLLEFSIFALGIYPVITRAGLGGVSLFTTLIYVLSLLLHLHYAGRVDPSIPRVAARIIGKTLAGTAVMAAGVLALKTWVFMEVGVINLIVLICAGVVFYVPLALLMIRGLRRGVYGPV